MYICIFCSISVEMGSHAELMEKKGIFYNLVDTQSQSSQIIGIA